MTPSTSHSTTEQTKANQQSPKTKPSLSVAMNVEALSKYQKQYTNLPFEAILKQDLLRQGLAFTPETLQKQNFKNKDYFIFTFDHVPLENQEEHIRFRMPEEIRIYDGCFNLRPTVVSVRNNPSSPYRICLEEDKRIALYLHKERIAYVEFPPIPTYYHHKTKDGKLPGEIAPVIEWGYLIYLTVFRNCQYFGKEEECAFCDINHNYRQQKHAGRPYTGIKSLSEILEVLSWIDAEDTTAQVYTITGGSITKSLRGLSEADFYFEYIEGIQKRFGNRWMSKLVSQAWEKEELWRFKDAGLQVYHPNYEVWDKKLFDILCPGKAAFIGRDKWMQRIIDAAKVFGAPYVIPNFVAGVELAQPHGFRSVKEAIASTAEGLDFFMSHGVMPRFTTWCPEPFTTLSSIAEQPHPPLEYFLELLSVWKETFEKYKLPIPPGYGEAGAGKAVFSVSAFMDVINPN